MICTRCGNYVSDDLQFCTECGARLTPATNVQQSYPAPAPYASQTHPAPARPAATAAPGDKWRRHFIKSWRKFATSTPALVLLICATLTQILGLFGVAGSGMLGAALGALGGGDAADALGGAFASASFISMLPGILAVVAMWMLYLDARTPGPRLNLTGMTILKILQIVSLVGTCIASGLGLLLMLGLGGGASKLGLDGLSGILGLGAWLLVLVAAVGIAYGVLVVKTVSAMKTALENCRPDPSFAMVLGVLQIISGVVSVFSSFIGGFNFGALLGAACSILYGWLLVQYKGLMENLSNQYRRVHGSARPY